MLAQTSNRAQINFILAAKVAGTIGHADVAAAESKLYETAKTLTKPQQWSKVWRLSILTYSCCVEAPAEYVIV